MGIQRGNIKIRLLEKTSGGKGGENFREENQNLKKMGLGKNIKL